MQTLFGTIRPDGLRQYKTAFLFLPRKQGKSTLIAAVGLYVLCGEPEMRGEIVLAAKSREQASIIFDEAAAMVRQDATLSKVCRVYDSTKRIIFDATGSVLKAISSESATAHGGNISCCIIDEVHSFGCDRRLYDVLTTSQGARLQPITILITTAGNSLESLAHEQYEYAVKVKSGAVSDPTFLPVIYESPQSLPWDDESGWYLANPALGDYRSIDELRTAALQAKILPAKKIVFERLYLNRWNTAGVKWLDMTRWDACGKPIDLESLAGRECWAGLDLAAVSDFSALALLFKHSNDPGFDILPFFWIPRAQVTEKMEKGDYSYSSWERDGLIEVIPGDTTDFDLIRKRISELADKYKIKKLAIDMQFDGHQFTNGLVMDGIDVVPCRTGWRSQSPPLKHIEKLVIDGHLNHGGNKVARWMAGNAVVTVDANENYILSKTRNAEKIDFIAALSLAVSMADLPAQNFVSVYDDPNAQVYTTE